MAQLHKSGAAMSRSWLVFAHPELKTQWNALQQQSATDAVARNAKEAAEIEGDLFAKLTHALSGAQTIIAARAALEKQLKSNIISYIEQGYLFAFGYELPRTLSSIPQSIPNEAWAGKCNWSENTLSFKGLQFVDVRLTTRDIRNTILDRGVVDKTPTNSAGRRGVGSAIKAAFKELNKAGEINPQKSMSSHFPKIREFLEQKYPDLPVPPAQLSEKTLYRHLSIFFNDL